MTPDANGKIAVPQPAAAGEARKIYHLDGSQEDYGTHMLIKFDSETSTDGVFDVENNTFVWGSSVKAKIVYEERISRIPDAFVKYMIYRSALELNTAYQVNPNAMQMLARQTQIYDARMRAENMQLRMSTS